MNVVVFGAWYTERKGFQCKGTEQDFQAAARQIGGLLARLGHKLVVTSFSAHTVDGYVVDGYITWMQGQRVKPATGEPPIVLIKFDPSQQDGPDEESERRYDETFTRYPGYVTMTYARGNQRFNRHLTALKHAQAVVTIGGADHTFMAGEVALLVRRPLIPVGSFGGAAAELSKLVLQIDSNQQKVLGQLAGPWSAGVCDAMENLLSQSRVALIHGHGTDWQVARDCIADAGTVTQKFTPLVMKEQIGGSETLAHKWESLAAGATAAIAVITPDDLGGTAVGGPTMPRARQNIWLEIGWIWGRLGRQRLMVLIRSDVEIPSDFSGIEIHRYAASPAERSTEIHSFLAGLG